MLRTGKNVVFTCLIFCKNAVVLIFVSLNLGEQTNQPKKLSSPKLIKMLSAICLKLFSRTSSVNKIHVLNLKLKKKERKRKQDKKENWKNVLVAETKIKSKFWLKRVETGREIERREKVLKKKREKRKRTN